MTRIRTLEFLPTIFQTPTNSQFLGATLDQLVNPPVTKRIEGFIGSKLGYGINANDYYVTEPTKTRKDYQLEPGIIFTKNNESVANDFISYPGIIDAIKQQSGLTKDNNRLFESQFYSWDSFTNLDTLINYNQYYWLPEGPPAVVVSSDTVYSKNEYIVVAGPNDYTIRAAGTTTGTDNPELTLLRGGTYKFTFETADGSNDSTTQFWIQGEPTFDGMSAAQSNLDTRDVLGVLNNGRVEFPDGSIVFQVPERTAQDEFDFALTQNVDIVSDVSYESLQGVPLTTVNNIDGITDLDGKSIMFFNPDPNDDITYPGTYPSGNFYNVSIVAGNVVLTPGLPINTETKITPIYGTKYVELHFYKNNILNEINQIPYISAPLTTLYYQDANVETRRGLIKIIESNSLNTINVETDILGQKNYTSKNGVVFTNGLKVTFDGDIVPSSYLEGEYYVEGVGISIQLIPVTSLDVPESYTTQLPVPYDKLNYDIGAYDGVLNIPSTPDYITIARNSINKNPWSRSNRWFHIDVIKATAEYNDNETILTTYAAATNKAQRPIIEFYPNLTLFNSGIIGKAAVDFIDDRTTNIYDTVAGQAAYYPDVNAYSTYTGIVNTNPTLNMGQLIVGQQYKITSLGSTAVNTWVDIGSSIVTDGNFVIGREYIITDLGSTTNAQWNEIANTVGVIYTVGSIFTAKETGTLSGSTSGQTLEVLFTATNTGEYNSLEFQSNLSYTISIVGSTQWASIGGPASPVVGNTFTTNTSPAQFAAVGTGFATQGNGQVRAQTTTTIEIDSADITGTFSVGMYINDLIQNAQSVLPVGTRIYSITGTSTLTITVNWILPQIVNAATSASFVASNKNNADLQLFSGARIVFINETNPVTRNKIYIANFSKVVGTSYPIITLTEAPDGQVENGDQFVVLRGAVYQGQSFYLYEDDFKLTQQKTDVNQPPLFDVFNEDGISFGNTDVYESSTFNGSTLFEYLRPDIGVNDSVLGFPVSYSSINNVGDIRFNVSLNSQTFNYVSGPNQTTPNTLQVNTGYVYNFTGYKGAIVNAGNFNIGTTYRIATVGTTDFTAIGSVSNAIGTEFIATNVGKGTGTAVQISDTYFRDRVQRLLGWQTAVAPSTQYQVFEFNYTANIPPTILETGESITYTVTCDVPQLNISDTVWPSLQVYNNNELLILGTDYTVTNTSTNTSITVNLYKDVDTVIQVLILSDAVSNNAYYSIPINLSNNPFNTDITTVDIGDIRGHYQTIFYNNPNTNGVVFGANNTRDLGNLVPWGNRIIQNSASLVLTGAFLRTGNNNLFDALLFNSREYIKFKNLLIDTVNRLDIQQRFDPAAVLDAALDQMTSVKNQEMPFFWSDMIPNKAPLISNTYTFFNQTDTTTFPLSRIYDFTTANYYGVLVYLQTKNSGVTITKQLYKDIDYTVSPDSPSLVITTDLNTGDKIIIKEYNKTYGSFVPNTPTKLGLYPVTIPKVFLDTTYNTPTYFIVGHDGSFNKLYGRYDADLNQLIDFRDQALLEFETRVYNNLKLNTQVPVDVVDVLPGAFRNIGYGYNDWLDMYRPYFLNWVGQNRLDYKTQYFQNNNTFTYNYRNSKDVLSKATISQGYWRGIYQYYYDTFTPDQTPWQMIGYSDQPDWWETRYGPAPYTNNNLILWQDLENGIDWNNGNPVVIEEYKRPGLTNIIPVNDQGELLSPIDTIVGQFNDKAVRRDWIVGDVAAVELSYRRSSTWPFDLMRLQGLMRPADFFNLGADLDNYKYSEEFNQFLVNNRSHLIPDNIQIYGNGTAKTSYINWIVDYQKQLGVDATENITNLIKNLDVRLVFRLAGFSDKKLLKFFVEKGSPNSRNASLLIPDESYQILLYQNQATSKLIYSSVTIQSTSEGYKVFGNGQSINYFSTLKPNFVGNTSKITVQDTTVELSDNYSDTVEIIPYGTLFYTAQDVSQFILNYGRWLEANGAVFDSIEAGITVTWQQMIAEFLYWTQVGWEDGSVITLNPAAADLKINKESQIVQPLTLKQENFVLNQNLYPIENRDLCIFRDNTEFKVHTLNQGDTIAYGQFNFSSLEHGIVFDNVTLFDDTIYNLISGLKQNRIYVRGTKSAEWNGTMFASGFIYNQDNIQEWNKDVKYTKGSIVKYKNKYWAALTIVQPSNKFNENEWKETEYDEIQKGLLPNSSTRSVESTLYYNSDKANLEGDADQLSFSLIGFRNRPYMESADLTDITQVNVYKNIIKEKGTRAIMSAFKNAQLPQGGIDYNIYENWAILQGTFGGILNNNFVQFKLNESKLTGNPSIVGVNDGNDIQGAQQLVPLYSLFNYGRPITNTQIFPTVSEYVPSTLFPSAGYVNFNDVKMSAYFYSNLATAVDKNGIIVPINDFYVRDYVWIADYLAKWHVLTPVPFAQVLQARSNLNETTTIIFDKPHGLNQFDIFSIINFDSSVDGYYVALQILNPYQIIVNLTLPAGTREITGQGIGLSFSSQRVSQPSDIQDLPLINAEFVKNTVWVDENTDGGWGVYRKGINYQYDAEFTKNDSVTFGSAVSYTTKGDYLFGDAGAGKVYRYQYDALTKEYDDDQVITNDTSFGTTIAHEQNIFAISQPTTNPSVFLYYVNDTTVTDDIQFYQQIEASDISGSITNFGSALAISGDTNWLYISDYNESTPTARNNVHVYRKANETVNAGSFVIGQVYQISSVGTTSFTSIGADDNKVGMYFVATGAGTGTGTATRCNYEYINTIAGPNTTVDKFGYSLTTNYYGNILVVGAPTEDYDINTSDWGRAYVYNRLIQNFEAQEDSSATPTEFTLIWTPNPSQPLYVSRNGTLVDDSNYSISGNNLVYSGEFDVGDIISVSGNYFALVQELTTETNPRIGVRFGTSIDCNTSGTEVLVGAPFALSSENQEGAVYRYTYGGARFGSIVGTTDTDVTVERQILLNGYAVNIPAGDATVAATAINNAGITNIEAAALDGKLFITLQNLQLALANQELTIGVEDMVTLTELGINLYTQTQRLLCPHKVGATQFGTVVRFNEFNSVVVSAPVGTRFAQTTFDFVDDENQDNDTIFDNNATQFIEEFKNAGAVYMYDYLENYNESLINLGKYTYSQSCNARNLTYGEQPYYGLALDFSENKVAIGSPYFEPEVTDGQVIVYNNELGIPNWSLYRQSSPIVDINRVQNMQIFSAETNNTLINLDYIDPLQGKIFGGVRQNIDTISNIDPATYNNQNNTQTGFVWGAAQLGTIWFDTTNVKFVNYHQNDNTYNAKYWGTVFPGSDVAVYSWIGSTEAPDAYTGPGTPRDVTLYTVQSGIDSSNNVTPIYYYWVRNTGIIFNKQGKTLADVTLAQYISNPLATGISYLAPLLPDTVALYNCQTYINANDSVLSVGYSTGQNDDPGHTEYELIRENFATDFLPGVPDITEGILQPRSLYLKLLDSLCGVVNYDPGSQEPGQIIPDPYLPKAVQSGVLARPRQSFFYNRFLALKNYLQYANSVLKLFPITETRPGATFLKMSGADYDVTDYWEYINWWAVGFDDNTKSSVQVQYYADLAALNVPVGTIASVAQNSQGLGETYIYQEIDDVNTWVRIGLQNGTIKFKSVLWDYEEGNYGFGDGFFSTTPYDQYPNVETRWILRALNEQIYTNDLLIFRNKSLILLFEYIQAETVENQNYLPWLNKTSLIDVGHTIRELVPLQNFISDNQEFLEGYINETKPYHVVVKEFLFDYKGTDVYEGQITDFDLPSQYDATVNKFVSPELVYSGADTEYQFLPSSNVWTTTEYTNWYNNYGVSITGQDNYQITKLASYITLGTTNIIVDNAQGFPINGVIKIASINDPSVFEYIGYNTVDRELNVLGGLVRGLYGTNETSHIPGELIYIDLPPVLLLNGGKKYQNPPRIIAEIDTTVYPSPREDAQFEAVMTYLGPTQGYTVSEVKLINPGSGYAVLPKIVIDAAESYKFTSDNVNKAFNTITINAPDLKTGDLLHYVAGTENINGLANDEWYYINVLDTSNQTTIALYTTYADALNDTFRVNLNFTQPDNTIEQSLEIGARASAVSTSYPVRENNITLRYDRTTYDTQVTDWQANTFYSATFATQYNETLSSSGVGLESTLPDINNILSSSGGFALPIIDAENDQQFNWSGFERIIETVSSNQLVLTITTDPLNDANPSGSTIGFTVGMPVCFTGDVGGSGLSTYNIETQIGTIYYVAEIIDAERFTITTVPGNPAITINAGSVDMKCYTAQITNTAVLTVDYPGIRNATATSSTNNTITVPNTPSGFAGTAGLYTGLPVSFIGNVFGGIQENLVYYVTSVLDDNNFTMSEENNATRIEVYSINTFNQLIVENTIGLEENDPIVFDSLYINGVNVTSFGGIVAGTIYYVKELSNNAFTISDTQGGSVKTLTAVSDASNTYAFLVSQTTTVNLTDDTGSMTMNIALPISPGQISGKYFTLYPAESNYGSVTTFTYSNLLERTILHASATTQYIALSEESGGTENMYIGLPFKLWENIGGLIADTTYTVDEIGTISVNILSTSSSDNSLTCSTAEEPSPTDKLFVDMPIIFTGNGIGGVVITYKYYVHSIISGTKFRIKETLTGSAATLSSAAGNMTGNGSPYIICNGTITSDEAGPAALHQVITAAPIFDVSYVLGGYKVSITSAGQGFTLDNQINISGELLGGTSPANDLTLIVNGIDAIVEGQYPWSLPLESNGELTSIIVEGTPNATNNNYYLKAITPTTVEVYSDPALTVPVSGIDFLYGSGSFAYLPEPYYFNQSIVRYNNRIYGCVISNNDSEFVLGKWELIDAGNRKLNALDRVAGYYQPTVNMPGNDLQQLFTGLTYPNTTYQGNEFDPNYQYPVDTLLQDEDFYPTNVNLNGSVFNGINYILPANLPNYSALAVDAEVTDDWLLGKMADQPLAFTDIRYQNGVYILVSQNEATPIMLSTDSINWTINGFFIPFGTNRDENIYFRKKLYAAGLSLSTVWYNNPIWAVAGNNICTTSKGVVWGEVFKFDDTSDGYLWDIKYVTTPNFTGWISVGYENNKPCIVFSYNATTWYTVPQSAYSYGALDPTTDQKNASLHAVAASNNTIVIVGDKNVIYTVAQLSPSASSIQMKYKGDGTTGLNDVVFNNNTFVTVGDDGLILASSNGVSWFPVASPAEDNLNIINYENNEYTITGNNNTVLQATTIPVSGTVTWDTTQIFTRRNPAYTVQGAPFEYGYGPEELVPGVVTDQLTMIVNTRPGTNWPATEFAHVGYNVVSVEYEKSDDNEYNFNNVVNVPAQIGVFLVQDGLSTSLYVDNDYTVDWVNKIVTPNVSLTGTQMLRIDVYEVGNGDQLVKSSSQIDPIERNDATGFDEIYLDCNYTGYIFSGGGIVQPTTGPVDTKAISTDSVTNSIVVEDITEFTLDDDIYFTGDLFGGVTAGTTYYVKSINTVLSSIVISTTPGGAVFNLTDGSGDNMVVVIQKGPGQFWTKPAVFHNGELLTPGYTNSVIRTYSGTNKLVTYSTLSMNVGDKIKFDDSAFGGLVPQTFYTVESIISDTEFTLTGVVLSNAYGITTFVTNDYAAAVTGNNITAKVIFSSRYNNEVDYLSYSFLTETEPEQYGYTIPSVQTFTGTGDKTYALTNYIDLQNSINAIVEVNGLRVTPDEYVISNLYNTITFDSAIANTSTVSVTTFNDTQRQYLNTQSFASTVQVTPIENVYNTVTPILNETQVSSATGGYFIADSTTNMVNGQYIMFQSSSSGDEFGGVLVDGTMYILKNFNSGTGQFQVTSIDGATTYPTSSGAGLMQIQVGGQPAIRVQTSIPHGYTDPTNNDIAVRIDGITGSYQLNNRSFYIHVITPYQFDLYDTPFDPTVDAVNNPVTVCDSYVTGGYVWINESFVVDSVWTQDNVDRLWVTVNGQRVASSYLVLSAGNQLNILTSVSAGDDVIITSMMPSATPDQLTYINIVNKDGEGTVYRANSNTRTWLTDSVGEYETTITVDDISKITNENTQSAVAPELVGGYYRIGLEGNKNDLVYVEVYNNNPAREGYINRNYLFIEITALGPFVKIQENDDIQEGDSLTITSLEGKLLYIQGEYMRIEGLDTTTKVVDVARGVNGSAVQTYIPKYSEVYSLLEDNQMTEINYNSVWNVDEPLQIANTPGANFLKMDV